MRNLIHLLFVAALLVALVGCPPPDKYFTGTAPNIAGISPEREYSLAGCEHVVIEIDDMDQCSSPSVVFGSRNATVLQSEKVEYGDPDVDYWKARCHIEFDLDDEAINVISPPGPVAGGKVDVQVACNGGIAMDEYSYANGRISPDGRDLHEDEVSGFALFWQDGPFVNVPMVYGYGFVHEQPVPRQSIFLSGDHDAVATGTGIKPQTPPAPFELPEGADRLKIGDAIEFYYERDLQNDPVASYVGTDDAMNMQEENALFLGVYYERTDSDMCYAGAEMDGGGYFWGSGDTSDEAPKGCLRFYRVHPNLKSGEDADDNELAKNELPLDFEWNAIVTPAGSPDYETRTQEEGIELPTGTYYAYLTRGWRSFGYPFNPYDNLDVVLEFFPELYIEQGSTVITLSEEAAFRVPYDFDVHYYAEFDTGGENVAPQEAELFVRADGGVSYGYAIEAFDTDYDGDGEVDDGEPIVTIPPTDTGFLEPLGLYVGLPYYIDRTEFEGIEMTESDWEDFEGGSDIACTGILIEWEQSPDADDDFVTASLEVMEFGIGRSTGYTYSYRLVAFAWDEEERLCLPPQALAELPDVSDTFGTDDSQHETYAYSGFGSFNINKHRMNHIPIDELRGNMVVDAAHLYGSYFFTVSDCEDAIDNDGDGFIDLDDPGCDTTDPEDHWEIGGECDDRVDNDGDGMIDMDDPECDSLGDPSEGEFSSCNDEWDNDGDGWIDYIEDDPDTEDYDESLFGDPGCESADDGSEDNENLGECADGFDNDGDGAIDGYDEECSDMLGQGWAQLSESPQCSDGLDNDGDGFIDDEDPECDDDLDNLEAPTGCEDGLDNDGDGWIDADDPDCYYFLNVSEAGIPVAAWECGDGNDNDGDGLIDGNDPGSINAEDTNEEAPDASCLDGLDNDNDGWIDTDDPDCFNEDPEDPGSMLGTECNDDTDNDLDGFVDSEDPECDDAWDDAEAEPECSDGIDNDGDCWIDNDDPDCYLFGGPDEAGQTTGNQCSDGTDNDGDGYTDGCDPDCEDYQDNDEEGPASCSDGADNDADGWIDYDDPDCWGSPEVGGGYSGTQCNNGTDDDGDGDIDSADSDCDDAWDDNEAAPLCDNGMDDDGDCWTDLDDPGCADALDNDESNGDLGECADGIDNDGDSDIDGCDGDCIDAGTASESTAATPPCDDGIDNDGDGWTDLDDPGCADAADDDETDAGLTQCNDGADNDGDGDIDEADADCADGWDDDEAS